MGWLAAGYTFLVVLPSYLQNTLHTGFRQALLATVLANLGFAATIVPAGLLSDRIGRRPASYRRRPGRGPCPSRCSTSFRTRGLRTP